MALDLAAARHRQFAELLDRRSPIRDRNLFRMGEVLALW
jgi:hypothetical protein